jgi:predicted small secreted protein
MPLKALVITLLTAASTLDTSGNTIIRDTDS